MARLRGPPVAKPTFASVTKRRCTCGALERNSEDSEIPIVFDARMNEFSFRWPSKHGDAHLLIYHCPFCGGAAPQSKRDTLFAVVSTTEARRLHELLSDIKTIEEAIKKLGP